MTTSWFAPVRMAPLAMLCVAAAFAAGCTAETASTKRAEPAAEDATVLTTGHPVTVIDDGSGAELCLGFVMQPLPPACDGPRVENWEWSDWSGHHEELSGARWGEFAVTGTYDAETNTFTATEIVPGPVRSVEPVADETAPVPAPADLNAVDESELQAIHEAESAVRDDVLVWVVDPMAGEVTMQVVFDEDGTLQSEMDEKHGPGIVRLLSSLEPVG
ncbi:hypothetical protein [Microbacterium sp. NPDC056234]|uniref:hypothetical protein n=1 Tax=Microbacterium sp. NPDC056234 TaxID=3345757 RepID=UPI0035DB468F